MTSKTERMLLKACEEQGLVGLKVDMKTKGMHSSHDAGDVVVGRPRVVDMGVYYDASYTLSELFVIEEKYKRGKSTSAKYITEDSEKIDGFLSFAEGIGATPVLAVRWSQRTPWSPGAFHLLRDAREVERTPSGNWSVTPGDAENWQTVEDFF